MIFVPYKDKFGEVATVGVSTIFLLYEIIYGNTLNEEATTVTLFATIFISFLVPLCIALLYLVWTIFIGRGRLPFILWLGIFSIFVIASIWVLKVFIVASFLIFSTFQLIPLLPQFTFLVHKIHYTATHIDQIPVDLQVSFLAFMASGLTALGLGKLFMDTGNEIPILVWAYLFPISSIIGERIYARRFRT